MSISRLSALRQLTAAAARRSSLVLAQAPSTNVSWSAVLQQRRSISSSPQKPAGHGVAPNTVIDNPPRTAEDFAEAATKPRNWISYGYFTDDLAADRDFHALVMFTLISVLTVGSMFLFGYMPDFKNQEWGHREAYLELQRREKNGLPLVDKEFIPLDRIQLPSEEELEGVEVYL